MQRILGLKTYVTAWSWLHKLRRAMVRPGRDRLRGTRLLHHGVHQVSHCRPLTGEDPGAKGTLLRFTDRLKQKGSPPMDIGVVENGLSRSPRFVVDGLIRNAAGDVPFHRGDPSGDGRVTVADVI